MAAGMPSVSEITARLEQLGEPGSSTARMTPFFKGLKQILLGPGQFQEVNFELMLHALEALQPLLYSSNPDPIPVSDYFRSVLRVFVEPNEQARALGTGSALSYWRGIAFYQIASLIAEKLAVSAVKEKHLSDLLLPLHEKFEIKLFTLNYDDLIDRVGLPWLDGFIPNKSNFYEAFDLKTFLEADKSSAPLLVHMHGSTRFGYCHDGIFDIHKYKSPETAINYMDDKGFSQNVHGRVIISGPIISGLSKVEQLMFRPIPYGYYFKSFMDNLVNNSRLLILGYGGWDRHINEWISQFVQVHGTSAQLAFLGNVSNTALLERITELSPEAPTARKQSRYHGNNLFLEPAPFPFVDAGMNAEIAEFLAR